MIGNTAQKRPFDLLNRSVDKNVTVGIKGGKEFTGKMESFDVHMNIILVNASFKDGESKKEFKNIFIRGDSVIYISPVE
jgi:small nuclear ribonucleoprotein